MICWEAQNKDVEKARQHRSRFAQTLNVPKNVRLEFSLAAVSLNGLFEHPPVGDSPIHLHSFPLKYMQVDSPDLTFQVLTKGICPFPRISTTKSTNPEIGSFSI